MTKTRLNNQPMVRIYISLFHGQSRSRRWGGANPKHAGICHLGMGKNGEKWGKMGQMKNFEIHV